jgi:hypothetical protein
MNANQWFLSTVPSQNQRRTTSYYTDNFYIYVIALNMIRTVLRKPIF